MGSCGIVAFQGSPPTVNTIEVMKKEGIDVSAYRSKGLNKELIDNSDIIFVMESFHKEEVLKLAPQSEKKTHLLKEFVKEEDEKSDFVVSDPIGKPMEVYERVFDIIKSAVKKLIDKIT